MRHSILQVYGDGKQTRSFAYVSDLVDGLMKLMASNYTQPVNLGNPEEHTILSFAKIIKGVIGTFIQDASLHFTPMSLLY